ncbi:MAG: hypothetical protein ACREMG_02390, partial [Gemmatimonadales bacterium]
ALHLSAACQPLAALLVTQPYIAGVMIDHTWQVQDTAPATPSTPPQCEAEGEILHLGYRSWPPEPLPFYTASIAGRRRDEVNWSPWITAPRRHARTRDVLFHWTDRWFELKYGLTQWVVNRLPGDCWALRCAPGSRFHSVFAVDRSFSALAGEIVASQLVVTDCSAVHVLATALGVRTVVVEPEVDRHHFIFWPGSLVPGTPGAVQDPDWPPTNRSIDVTRWQAAGNLFGRLIHPVIGTDGRPSFDCRHTLDLIAQLLAETPK